MSTNVKSLALIDQIENLPPLPNIVQRILEITESGTSSARDVARVLGEDQIIAAKILRVANSPFFGVQRRVTQISRAVVVLGSIAVRNLVIGVCTRETLAAPGQQQPDHALLWRHSIAVAAACDLIARRIGYDPPEEAFVAGLLHDIGQLAMVTFQPEAFRSVLVGYDASEHFVQLEQSYWGQDHTQVGAKILENWKLPDVLCRVVREHHRQAIQGTDDHARLLALVMLGDVLAHAVGVGFDVSARDSRRARACARFLKMADSQQAPVLASLQLRIQETMQMFDVADARMAEPERPPSKRAVWVSDDKAEPNEVGLLLLERCGYEAQSVTSTTQADDLSHDDLIIIDHPKGASPATELARELAEDGFGKVVVLGEVPEGMSSRQRDSKTGVCIIPRLFTVFDIKWAERKVQQ